MKRVLLCGTAMLLLPVVALAGPPPGLLPGNNLSDLPNPSAARVSLGLGTISTQNAGAVVITGGTLDNVVLGSTTPLPSASITNVLVNRTGINYTGTSTHTSAANTALTVNSYITGAGGGTDSNGSTDIWASGLVFAMSSDTLQYTGNNYTTEVELQHNFGGAGQTYSSCTSTPSLCGTGAKSGEVVVLTQKGPTANTTNTPYVGQVASVAVAYNDGGVSGYGNSRGAITAHNAIAAANSGATYLSVVKAYEGDVTVQSGASTKQKFGMLLQEQGGDAVAGSSDDTMLDLDGYPSTVGFSYLIGLGKSDSVPPTNSTTTVLGCPPNNASVNCTGAYGINLSSHWTWPSGSFPFSSPGHSVDYQGNTTVASLTDTGLANAAVVATNSAGQLIAGSPAASATLCTAYTAPGSYTYVVSSSVKWFSLMEVGGGSSGGAGFVCTSGTACSGGAGGSGGGVVDIPPTPIGAFAGTNQTIVVGAGGASVSTSGAAGNAGANTTGFGYVGFGGASPAGGASSIASASGGTGGSTSSGGNASGATAGIAPQLGGLAGSSGVIGQSALTLRDIPASGGGSPAAGGVGGLGGFAFFGPAGGGAGGGIPATAALEAGGGGGRAFATALTAAGSTAGSAGSAGVSANNAIFGSGGGGGANNTSGNGGAGGIGANGAGGGGGGSSIGGTAGASGAGGSGAAMVCTGG